MLNCLLITYFNLDSSKNLYFYQKQRKTVLINIFMRQLVALPVLQHLGSGQTGSYINLLPVHTYVNCYTSLTQVVFCNLLFAPNFQVSCKGQYSYRIHMQ